MKYNNTIIKVAGISALLLLLAGCNSNEDSWTPGPVVTPINQVFFAEESMDLQEIGINEESTCTITLSREDETTDISVPIAVTADEGFEVPETVDFAAGEKTATLTVKFNGAEKTGYYNCSLNIDDPDYCNPYSMLTTTFDVQLLVANWELYKENVRLHDDSGTLDDWYVDMYKNEMESGTMYRFARFMKNYNLTFKLQDIKGYTDIYDIIFIGGTTVSFDDYDGWCFGDADDDGNAESYKLYPFQTDNYLDYTWLYPDPGNWYSYFDFTGWSYDNYGWDGCIGWSCEIYSSDNDEFISSISNFIRIILPHNNE